MENNKPILIYDELCPLCKRFKQGLEILDREKNLVEFRDANLDSTYEEFPQLDKENCLSVAHMILANGDLVTGGEIIVEISKIYPSIQKFAWLLESDKGRKVSNFFYKKAEQLRRHSLQSCYRCGRN